MAAPSGKVWVGNACLLLVRNVLIAAGTVAPRASRDQRLGVP
jgi:hypothetical protein